MFHWIRLTRDSRGNPSWVHSLVIPAFIAFTVKAIFGGLTIVMFGQALTIPFTSGFDYAAYVAPLLALFGTREYTEKKFANGNGNGTSE